MNNKYLHFLTGHHKFTIRQSWLVKGVKALENGNKIFSNKELVASIDYLGIGSNMVQSLRYWLKMFDLVDSNNDLTTNCKDLIKSDPLFSDDFSKWLLHIWISENSPLWQTIYVSDKVTSFDLNYLSDRLSQHLKNFNRNINVKTIKDLVNVFLDLYIEKEHNDPEKIIISPLESLNMIKKKSSQEYQISIKGINDISPAIILYIICNKNAKTQLSIHEVNDLIQKYINIDYLSIRKILENLAHDKIIIFDKSTGLNNITIENIQKYNLSFCWEYYHES